MAKSPLCDARYPVIPDGLCRRAPFSKLKNLMIHPSSCKQGGLYHRTTRISVSALRHTSYCCIDRYMKSCGGGDSPNTPCNICPHSRKTTDPYFMVSFSHQAS